MFSNSAIWSFFHEASSFSIKNIDERTFFIGALAKRKDGAIVIARNNCNKVPMPMAHAEARLSKKIDLKSIVFVCRTSKIYDTPHFALAKPCASCYTILKNKGVKRVYYTISENQYDYFDF